MRIDVSKAVRLSLIIACVLFSKWAYAGTSSRTAPVDCGAIVGTPVQGGLVWGKVAPEQTVTLDQTAVLTMPDGQFLLGFGRDAPATQQLVIHGEGGCRRELHVASREYRISRVDGVPQRTVTPPSEQLERIAREREWVRSAKPSAMSAPIG